MASSGDNYRLGILRTYTYPAYGGPGPVTGGLGDDSGDIGKKLHVSMKWEGKGLTPFPTREMASGDPLVVGTVGALCRAPLGVPGIASWLPGAA